MTKFIYEIEVTETDSLENIGDYKSLLEAHRVVKEANFAKGTLITIGRLRVIENYRGSLSYEHVQTIEFEVA